jgi:hypothetical protein
VNPFWGIAHPGSHRTRPPAVAVLMTEANGGEEPRR